VIYILPLICGAIATLKISTRMIWALVAVCCVFLALTYHDQSWGLYHYHTGSKYFRELGYFDLYECTLVALDEHAPRRDLHTYEFRFDAPDCQAEFTPRRWEAFRADLGEETKLYMRDKGLNATPTWIAVGERLAGLPRSILVSLDILTVLAATWIAGRLLGWRKAGYSLLFILVFYGTVARLTGHLGQWWWLGAVMVGIVLLERKRVVGGFWLGVATTLAVFPVFLLIGRSRRTLLYAALGLGAGLLIGLTTSRGISIYPEFLENMRVHSPHIRYEPFNIGLFNTLSMAESPQTLGEWLGCFRGGECRVNYEFSSPYLWWLLLLPVVAVTRLGGMFGLLTLSRYYYLILAVVPFTERERRVRWLFGVNAVMILWIILNQEAAYRWGHFLWVGYFASYWLNNPILAIKERLIPSDQVFTNKTALIKNQERGHG